MCYMSRFCKALCCTTHVRSRTVAGVGQQSRAVSADGRNTVSRACSSSEQRARLQFLQEESVAMLSAVLVAPAAILFTLCHAAYPDTPTCGYASCHKQEKGVLNVHIVAHSHDDVGWLKTMEEYFYGQRNFIYYANVSAILNSVFKALQENPDRRFVQVETAYLWMWWKQQSPDTRSAYRRLVQEGQLHIAGGGWSMSDEATTSYLSIINNFSWGFRRLNDSFGPCGVPRVGWQIDTFGHSRETAAIMALMGFDGTVINRIDYQDKLSRQSTHNMDFLWRASSNLDGSTELFTTALFDHYHPPPLCCWDVLCSDPDISDWNTEAIMASFMEYVEEQASYFSTNNVMVTMGNDFTYMDASRYYNNIDKLIELVNERYEGVHAMYSTPDCYVKAVHESNPLLSTHTDDFFPYASSKDVYWTGYYTSRPTLKYLERLASNFLQVCKQLGALSGLRSETLDVFREAMSVLQHHDAISGTERRRVADDYVRKLLAAMTAVSSYAHRSLGKLLGRSETTAEPSMTSCLLLNISQCEVSEKNEHFVVTLYNPLSRPVSHYVRLPVPAAHYQVTDTNGVRQKSQLVPVPGPVQRLKARRGESICELVFRAVDVPPLGLSSYTVRRSSSSDHHLPTPAPPTTTAIGNHMVRVEVNASSGLVSTMTSRGERLPLRQNILYYSGLGGAYVFRPGGAARPVADVAAYSVYTGDVVDEIHQEFNDWASQVVRVYKEEDHVEFEWLVGPIPIGTDVIVRYETDLRSAGQFRTDSNGRETLVRRRGQRANRRVKVTQPVAGNYYPVTARLSLRDKQTGLELAVLSDRAQGGSSLTDGHLELMLHRRLMRDDGLGLGEVLNDKQPARGRHYVLAGRLQGGQPSLAARQRLLVQSKLLQPWIFLAPVTADNNHLLSQYSGLKSALPDNVQLLSLEPWGENSLLIRLEHILGKDEDELLSRNVTVNLKELLAPLTVDWLRETTLDGGRWLSDMARLRWRTASRHGVSCDSERHDGYSVCLAPMQIRTFVMRVRYLDPAAG